MTTEEIVEYNYRNYDLLVGINPLFSELAIPIINSEGLYGYINSSGETIYDFQFLYATKLNADGYALVTTETGYAVLDVPNEEVIVENLTSILNVTMYFNYILVEYQFDDGSEEMSLYDYEGTLLLDRGHSGQLLEQYPDYADTGSSYFSVRRIDEDNTFVLVDPDGNVLTENSYDSIYFGYRQMMSIKNGGLFGIIDRLGNEIIEPIFRTFIKFGDYYKYSDIAYVLTEDDKLGFIDSTGEVLIEPTYDFSEFLNNPAVLDYYAFFENGVQMVPDGDIYKIIDYEGNVLFETEPGQYISDYTDELIGLVDIVEEEGIDVYYTELIDYEGNVIYSWQDVEIIFPLDGTELFFTRQVGEQDGYYYLDMYDLDGNLLRGNICGLNEDIAYSLGMTYMHLSFYNDLMLAVDRDTLKVGFIDKTGGWVIDAQFDIPSTPILLVGHYIFHSDGFAVVIKDSKYGIIDLEGNFLLECEYGEIETNFYDFQVIFD